MRINEILLEQQLAEGPLLNKIGTGVGKAVGAAGKAAGAVAGGVAGLGSAFKKGYQAGKTTVSKAGDDNSAVAGIAQGAAQAAKGQPAATSSATNDIMSQIDSLPVDSKRELVNKIQSSIQNAPKPAATDTSAQSEPSAPTSASASPRQQRVEPTLDAPAGNTSQASPATSTSPSGQNKAASDPYEMIKGQVRKVQGGAKPIPADKLQGIMNDIARMSKGDKEMGANVGQRILQLAKLGYDVKDAQTKFVGSSKLVQSVYRSISNMLREHGLIWSDLNLKVTLIENTDEYVYISPIKSFVDNSKLRLFRSK